MLEKRGYPKKRIKSHMKLVVTQYQLSTHWMKIQWVKNCDELSQYLHGGIDVSGERLSVAFVFRVVKETKFCNLCDDTLFCTESNGGGNVVTGVLGFDLGSFHCNLRSLYSKILL